ncbi:MAG: TetR/AcrR family transcriptional regulator [Acidimicrobiales bacterium]|nr:TetR/AcrR family transcriptional regulator [Acidimicrobiales bacterium]
MGAGRNSRRDEILAAALRCFLDKGVSATTIADIRAECGASVGSVYHHFPSKDELAAILYVEGLTAYHDGFLALLGRHDDDARAGVRALVRYHLTWVADHRDLARYLFATREPEVASAGQDGLVAENRRFLRPLAAWVRTQVAAGRLRPLPVALYQPLWLGPAQEAARNWLAGHGPDDLDGAATVLADAAWLALAPLETRTPRRRRPASDAER